MKNATSTKGDHIASGGKKVAHSHRRAKKKWDYAVVGVINEEPFVSECLWAKGDEGYELVGAMDNQDGDIQLFFKRPK